MKGKSLLFIFLFCILLKNIFPQTLLIPIDPFPLVNGDNEKNEEETEEDKPIVETKELKDEDGNNIRITRIHYHKTKNLSGNSEAITPIQIMRIFDDRVNSIFEDLIRQSIGIKMLLNGLSTFDEDENEEEEKIFNKTENEVKSIFQEFEFDDEEEKEDKNKIENKNVTIKKEKNDKEKMKKKNSKKEKKEEKDKDGKNNKKIGKFTVDNLKNKMKKNKKKLSRKELIFSRVCKYIFYSIILFTIYILVKKLLEVLEIIDPDNAVEIKIENDETSKLKKSTENKQN